MKLFVNFLRLSDFAEEILSLKLSQENVKFFQVVSRKIVISARGRHESVVPHEKADDVKLLDVKIMS